MKYRGPYKPEHNRLNTEAILEERLKKSTIKWPDFKFGPVNLWVMPPTKEAFNIIMEYLMSGGIESMFEEEFEKEKVAKPKLSRIDVIGQNGNDGLHYALAETAEKKHLTKLVDDHWNYIKDVLVSTKSKTNYEIDEIGFHYKTAFTHGWKHHKEYTKEEKK